MLEGPWIHCRCLFQHCDQSWVICGGLDYGDMSVCCGSCMLATELQQVRVYLRRWFLAVLDPYCWEVVAEFLVGSKLWLQKRMQHELMWYILAGKDYGIASSFTSLRQVRLSRPCGTQCWLLDLVLAFVGYPAQ